MDSVTNSTATPNEEEIPARGDMDGAENPLPPSSLPSHTSSGPGSGHAAPEQAVAPSNLSAATRTQSRSTDVDQLDDKEEDEEEEEGYPPDHINVHQFYPALEHKFDQGTANFSDPSSQAMAVVVAEKAEQEEAEDVEWLLAAAKNNESDAEEDEDEDKKDETEENAEEAVFSTAVDEETLAAAQQRAGLFNPEDWSQDKVKTPSMSEIITEKATEHLSEAKTLVARQDYQQAIIRLSKAIQLQTEDVALYVERAEAYVQVCDFQSAILNYKRACLLAPDSGELYGKLALLYFVYGQILYDQRIFPEALEAFSRAAEMKPDNIHYHMRSVSCLAALERHGECLALVNKRLEVDKDNPDLYIMRARLHEMFRNTTLCYYDVKDALSLDAGHGEARLMMDKLQQQADQNRQAALSLTIQGKHREALQKISVAIETNPSVAEFHVIRGALHRSLTDYNAAIDDFLLALDKCDHNEEHPVYADAQRQLLLTYNDFAVECFRKGYYEEAVILLNKAIKGEKNEKGLYVNRGDCFYKQEDLNFALQDYHQALELDATDQSIKSRIASIHYMYGERAYHDKIYHEAEAKFTLAIQYNPHVGSYYIYRARTRYMIENTTGARQDLILGLLLDPTNEDIVSILSRLFPGKSVADVIHSPAADQARVSLNHLASTASPVKLRPLHSRSPSPQSSDSDSDSESTAPDGGTTASGAEGTKMWQVTRPESPWKLCVEEHDFNLVLAYGKRMVKSKVEDALRVRKPLTYEGPRIQPLPPASKKPQFGGNVLRREQLITNPQGKKKSTGWRTFSHTIGRNN